MRLTNDMRGKVVLAIVRAAFQPREEALKERQHDLTARVRNTLCGKKNSEILDALPEGYVSRPGTLYVHIRSSTDEQDTHQMLTGNELALPVSWQHNGTSINEEDHPRLYTALAKFMADDQEMRTERRNYESKVEGVLDACSTSEKLEELWPTAIKLMPEGFFTPPAKPQLPATIVNELDVTLKAGMKAAA